MQERTRNLRRMPQEQSTTDRGRSVIKAAYTNAEACLALSITRSTLYELIRCGRIRAVKIGSRGHRIPLSEIERFLSGEEL